MEASALRGVLVDVFFRLSGGLLKQVQRNQHQKRSQQRFQVTNIEDETYVAAAAPRAVEKEMQYRRACLFTVQRLFSPG